MAKTRSLVKRMSKWTENIIAAIDAAKERYLEKPKAGRSKKLASLVQGKKIGSPQQRKTSQRSTTSAKKSAGSSASGRHTGQRSRKAGRVQQEGRV